MHKEVWRIAGPEGGSMWYNVHGDFSPILPVIAEVPMEIDPLRLHLGPNFLSGVDNPDLLEVWFPGLTSTLTEMGFTTHRFIAEHWRELPNEIVFDITTAKEIDL